MPRELAFTSPPALAVAVGATTPVGQLGAEIWSTTALRRLVWTGTQWVDAMGGATGNAGGVLSGTYPNPGFAVDMATQAELNAATGTREPTIAAGTVAQYWRGDKTWRDLATDVRAAVLTGFTTATGTAVAAADSVLVAFGKLQAQINGHFGAGGATHPNATASVSGFLSAADKAKLDGVASGATANVGTVTSVGLAAPVEFTIAGSPVSGAGTLTFAKASQTANQFYAAPNGASGVPVFRAMVAADVPVLNQSTTGNAGTVTNGVYTIGDQTIGGVKTFSSPIAGATNSQVSLTGDQTIGGTKHFSTKVHITSQSAAVGTAGSVGNFEIGSAGVGAAAMSFHRAGYAINMGLDTDNVFRLGGWSQGLNVHRWTSDTSGNFTALGNITAGGQFLGNGSVPPGAVMHFAMNSPPTGWLRANGAAVSRTTFAALFTAIGTTYGAGDGSTTFNLPDLRGEFIRGFDDGRGVDTGRNLGSAQAHQMQSHNHAITTTGSGGGTLAVSTAFHANAATRTGFLASAGGTSNGSENRPRNIAMLACIKF